MAAPRLERWREMKQIIELEGREAAVCIEDIGAQDIFRWQSGKRRGETQP